MKIYAITQGDYSDYHICALTVNKNKAERLKEIYSDEYDEAEIEEYEDSEAGEELRVPFIYWTGSNSAIPCSVLTQEGVNINRFGELVGAVVLSTDAEHAKKKAQDMIAKYKAEQEGL